MHKDRPLVELRVAECAGQESHGKHKAAHVTPHYSAADISSLIVASEKVCEFTSRISPALSIVRSGGVSQVPEIVGGKGGTRTLDPGIMRSDDKEEDKKLQQVAWSAVQLSAVCSPMFSTECRLRGHKKWHTSLGRQLSTSSSSDVPHQGCGFDGRHAVSVDFDAIPPHEATWKRRRA